MSVSKTKAVSLKPYQVKLVEFLLTQGVLQFGEFKLKSGRLSPYYYNARNLNTGEALSRIGQVYAEKIASELKQTDVIFGPAYAGIPLVAATGVQLAQMGKNVRVAYDRKEAKSYGDAKTGSVIMGDVKAGDHVLLVDDMVTTGGTKLEVKDKILQNIPGVQFVGILVVFDRKEKDDAGVYSGDALKAAGLPLHSVLNAPDLFEYLHNRDVNGKVHVNDAHYAAFQAYRKQYGV